jgi:hypothetical protein
MFNVLPDNLKEKIKKQYRLRRLVVVLIFVLFVQISFLIFLFPSWIMSEYKERDSLDQINFQNSSVISQNTDAVLQTINDTNTAIDVINTAFKYPKVVPLFDAVISAKSKSISLRQLTYSAEGTSTASLSLEGIAATRQDLVSFVENLQKSGSFANVVSPVSNLEKDRDIDFSVSLDSN